MEKIKNKVIKGRMSNKQRSENTYSQLITIARKLFGTRGYSDTSLEEIVRHAGLTRGALYHHFKGKKGLFIVVFEDALAEVANRLIKVESSGGTTWERFMACTYEFFKACLDSDLQRIILIDAPAVLGWEVWRKVDQATTLDILRLYLKELLDDGIIQPMPLEPLTRFISGAVNEAVLWIARSKDPENVFDEAWSTMEIFLNSLKK
jgi:AcrR family transcriptional regulator